MTPKRSTDPFWYHGWDIAAKLAHDGRERFEAIYKRNLDGISVPPDTQIRVIVVLEHIPEDDPVKKLFEGMKAEA